MTFAYWTDGVFDPSTATPTDPAPTMTTPDGKIAPAPWVPYTRAGCDVGSVATANTILENTVADVPKVFGAGSPEADEAAANPGLALTDFVGIGVHCAKGSAVCAAGNARPDVLPDEPGGYDGFQALYGAKYVNPVISPNGPVTTVDGTSPIADAWGEWVPRLRRDERDQLARLRRPDAGGRHPGHLRVHLRCARPAPQRPGVRAG